MTTSSFNRTWDIKSGIQEEGRIWAEELRRGFSQLRTTAMVVLTIVHDLLLQPRLLFQAQGRLHCRGQMNHSALMSAELRWRGAGWEQAWKARFVEEWGINYIFSRAYLLLSLPSWLVGYQWPAKAHHINECLRIFNCVALQQCQIIYPLF